MAQQPQSLEQLNRNIVSCQRCPRLVRYLQEVGRVKRAAYREQDYFSKPVPNFGDTAARILVVGLAPGAHGANRTGRMFTGDRSGDFLFEAMHRAGLANQPTSNHVKDGLSLRDVLITAACHCAPPGNKPLPVELEKCAPFLVQTFSLAQPRVVVCLGGIALQTALRFYVEQKWIEKRAGYRFAHGAEHVIADAPTLLCSYHPSQQNTFTKRLTMPMLVKIFERAKKLAGE